MRKIYILLVAIMVTTLTFGQELLSNGNLESWDDSTTPTGWTKAENLTQETSDVHGGTNAAKRDAGSGTKDLAQSVTVVGNDTYTVSLWYKVVSGDGADVRIWSSWKDASGDYLPNEQQSTELKGPDDGYLPNNGNVWTEYTTTINAPADAVELAFEVRSYSMSVVIWDDLSVMHEAVSAPSLTVSSPEADAFFETGTFNISYAVANFNIANGSGDATQDGHVHWKIDNDNPAMVYDPTTADIAVSGLANGMHTLYMFLVDNSHNPLDPAVEVAIPFIVGYTQVADIAALQADVTANGDGNYYEITGSSLVTHTDSYKNRHWIQDTNIAGIQIYDKTDPVMATYAVGDMVSGLKGQSLVTYNGELRFLPKEDAGTVDSSGNTVTPQIVDINTFNTNHNDYESELVQINGVTFTAADGTATFGTNTSYDFTDGTNTAIMRSAFYGADYIDGIIPSGNHNLVGIASEYQGTAQLYARNLADMTVASLDNNTIKGFNLYPNPVNGTVLNITTLLNLDKNIQIFNLLGKQVVNKTITGTTIDVSNLNAGIYLIKVEEAGSFATSKLVIK